MGILRIHKEDEEVILLVCAYLQHIPSRTNIQRRQNPEDNSYKYLFHHGHLWIDLITVSRVNGPLIGFYDSDMRKPIIHTIDSSTSHRFVILRPFFQDSRHINSTTISSYKTFLNNMLCNIVLPTSNELLLFNLYAYPVKNTSLLDEYDNELELDIVEH
jgi:hypothetical protein